MKAQTRSGFRTSMLKLARLGVCIVLACFANAQAADRHVVLITIDGFPGSMFADTNTSIPQIRQLAKSGAVAKGMQIVNPTITWPNHTTLMTGVRPSRHTVLFNGVLVRGEAGVPVVVDGKKDKSDLVAVPMIFDLLHEKGMRTAAIDWPCTRNSAAVDDNFPDVPENLLHTTPRLKKELMAKGVLTSENDKDFRALSGPKRDEIWAEAACQVIRERKPHLLVLHLLNTDSTHHKYGPQSPASYTALALADFYVGKVLAALDASGIRKQTTIFVVADHGFAVATNLLQPNVLLKQAGLLQTGASNLITKASAQVYPEGGSGMVYLTDPATRDADRLKVIELFTGREGIAEVIQTNRFDELGIPLPTQYKGAPDLVIAAKDGYGISGSAVGEYVVPVAGSISAGYHGYLASNPRMNALFVVAGRGVKPGVQLDQVNNVDIAPTIAHLLGQEMSGVEGKVLKEILTELK